MSRIDPAGAGWLLDLGGQAITTARSGMNICPMRLAGVPLHPVSVATRHLPLRGYRPGLEHLAGHLVTLDKLGMPPGTGGPPAPARPGLWFFGLDRSIYGNMHIRRRQARELAGLITR